MKYSYMILAALLLAACKDNSPQAPQPQQSMSRIVAYVHWDTQALAGKQIVLLQTGDTLKTDSAGLAKFSVPAGHYVIRALAINRGGPISPSVDFEVDTHSGETTKVDIVDCLPCV